MDAETEAKVAAHERFFHTYFSRKREAEEKLHRGKPGRPMPDIKPKKAGSIASTAALIPLFFQPRPTDISDQLLVHYLQLQIDIHINMIDTITSPHFIIINNLSRRLTVNFLYLET